ncbi:MAG: hypothetical protein KJZ65_12620 [Phycisphaerales bacterium]|nr:hypothetical protein [Phycisphaerales bacterium]
MDIQVWAQLSGPVLDLGTSATAGFRMDLPIVDSLNLETAVAEPVFGLPYFHQWFDFVSAAGLFDVCARQPDLLDLPIFTDYPILLFTTRQRTAVGAAGSLELVPKRHDSVPVIIAWWIELTIPVTQSPSHHRPRSGH